MQPTNISENPRAIWERRYRQLQRADMRPNPDPWLARWAALLGAAQAQPVLDLGCGNGQDAAWLLAQGWRVIAGDYSPAALASARVMAPRAQFVQMDLRDGLPFANHSLPIIVAGLCLHYFRWQQTQAILHAVARCLHPGGILLARLNSTHDIHHGAVGHAEIEPGCYVVAGALKHFFTREDLARLFSDDWEIHSLEEMTIHRYQYPKVVWEIVARVGPPARSQLF